MNDVNLIELVRINPVLFDVTHPKYMDAEFKNEIWKRIGVEMESSGIFCRTRWNNIRDNYRKFLRKDKTIRRQKPVRPYKYCQHLSFLSDHLGDRENSIKVDNNIFTEEWIVADEDYDGRGIIISFNNIKKDDSQNYLINQTSLKNMSQISATERKNVSTLPKRKRKKVGSITAPLAKTPDDTVIDQLVDSNVSESNFVPIQHPVDAFLAGIAPVLKKLTPRHWHYAKGELFATVQKYELQTLMESNEHIDQPSQTSIPPTVYTTVAQLSLPMNL